MEHVLEHYPMESAQASAFPQVRDDDEAVRLCRKGYRQAYGFLVKSYMQRAYFCALGLVGSHEDALDLSQEAFVRAYRAIDRFELGRSFFGWYYKILRNLCLNYLRDKKLHARSFSEIGEVELNHLQDERQSVDTAVEQTELREKVWTALHQLKPADREIILLKDFQDYSYKEIADLLDIPIGTVMSRLFNARRNLKSKLERIYP
ncbi:MAG: sigma-70 family RNA polymerase sigma factor [candidate division KSB1 bacterium]|nr:sigma-70 family RNA polymerase sigma factor [candidate division KSB1 bacterium]